MAGAKAIGHAKVAMKKGKAKQGKAMKNAKVTMKKVKHGNAKQGKAMKAKVAMKQAKSTKKPAKVLKKPAASPRSRTPPSSSPHVRSTTDSGVGGAAVYETARAVDEYLQFHYASDAELMPYKADVAPTAALAFPRRCADLALAAQGRSRALDIGCSVGGMSFHLASSFESVIGIDFSHAFIDMANKMKMFGSHDYQAKIEATIFETRTARVHSGVDRSRVHFEQGDACALRDDIGTFDVVLGANLLCRLPEPTAFLDRVRSLLNPGGVLVLVSPYSWLPEYTDKDKWLGGKEDGKLSFDVLSEMMAARGFRLVEKRDMPFLIREHARKYQWGCSDGTVWAQQ